MVRQDGEKEEERERERRTRTWSPTTQALSGSCTRNFVCLEYSCVRGRMGVSEMVEAFSKEGGSARLESLVVRHSAFDLHADGLSHPASCDDCPLELQSVGQRVLARAGRGRGGAGAGARCRDESRSGCVEECRPQECVHGALVSVLSASQHSRESRERLSLGPRIRTLASCPSDLVVRVCCL